MPDLYSVSLATVKSVLNESRPADGYLDNMVQEHLDEFTRFLREELNVVVADAIEIAFLRTMPESIYRFRYCTDCDHNPCVCSHDYVSKDHCQTCSNYWVANHMLVDCISKDFVLFCPLHKNHSRTECKGICAQHSVVAV
jgi:hypothetical protein